MSQITELDTTLPRLFSLRPLSVLNVMQPAIGSLLRVYVATRAPFIQKNMVITLCKCLLQKITIFKSRAAAAANARIKYCYKYMVKRITLKLIWFK